MFRLIAIAAIFLSGCFGCQKNSEKDSPWLDRDYDFVLGFAIPDEDRIVPTEVFVGRMIDRVPEDITIRDGMQDTFLLKLVQAYQAWYTCSFEYHDSAEVTITSDSQSVLLQPVGYGTYRDTRDELQIAPLGTYILDVRLPNGRHYSKSVTVPGDINVTNFAPGDTLFAQPKRETPTSPICVMLHPITHNTVSFAHLYRHWNWNDGPGEKDPPLIYFNLHPDGQLIPVVSEPCSSQTVQHFDWTILAMDSSASRFYRSEGFIAGNKDVFDLLDYYDYGPIENRSSLNTHGVTDAVGNFGAFNMVRLSFVVKMNLDSCECR